MAGGNTLPVRTPERMHSPGHTQIKYGKDRGTDPMREKEDFPWFWTWDEKAEDFVGGAEFDGARWNDPHYSLSAKQKARDRKMQLERA